jgi:hypothetical protein
MDIPMYLKVEAANGTERLLDHMRFANEKCNEISRRAWERRAVERQQIADLVDADDVGGKVGPMLINMLVRRVADAFSANAGAYAPTRIASLYLGKGAGARREMVQTAQELERAVRRLRLAASAIV